MWTKSLLALSVCLTALSCIRSYDFEKPVPSGLRLIPEAGQMESLFGPALHKICNLNERKMTAEWQTLVFVGDRYELAMRAPVRLPESFEHIEAVLKTPEFELREVSAITNNGFGAKYDPKGQHRFDLDDWRKLYRAKGDFSVIGIQLKNQAVVDFGKYRNVMFRGRVAAIRRPQLNQ